MGHQQAWKDVRRSKGGSPEYGKRRRAATPANIIHSGHGLRRWATRGVGTEMKRGTAEGLRCVRPGRATGVRGRAAGGGSYLGAVFLPPPRAGEGAERLYSCYIS